MGFLFHSLVLIVKKKIVNTTFIELFGVYIKIHQTYPSKYHVFKNKLELNFEK